MNKEDIRHDPVKEKIVKGVQYIKENQNLVFKIFAGILLMVGVFSYYNHVINIKINSSSKIVGLAQNTFINGNIDEAMVKFERVLADYPSTPGAAQSLVYLLNDAITKGDYKTVSSLISTYKGGIDDIDDPIIKSSIYKIQGDMALYEGNPISAISYYYKADNSAKAGANQLIYKLDVVSALLVQENYIEAQNELEKILNIKDVSYNEKNKLDELMAFLKYKLGT